MNHLIKQRLLKTALPAGIRSFHASVVNMKKLEGKVAIVTASTAGIGYAIAQGLAENGAKVVISSRKQENVNAAVESLTKVGLDVSGVVCHVGRDVDRKSLIQQTVDQHGKLDILISNAGVNPVFGPLLKTPEAAWDKIFDLNLKAGFLLAKEATPHLRKTQGSMLFVSSIGGYNPVSFIGAYSISKTALLGLVKALAAECAPMNVRVNGIAPGIIETNFSSALTEVEQISKKMLESVPLNRFGKASECAGAAVFLSSDDASFVTGEIIAITGGMQSRL